MLRCVASGPGVPELLGAGRVAGDFAIATGHAGLRARHVGRATVWQSRFRRQSQLSREFCRPDLSDYMQPQKQLSSALVLAVLGGSGTAVGWAATHVVDRLTSSPILEYAIVKARSKPAFGPPQLKQLGIVLTNLTRDTTFKNLGIVLVAPEGTEIVGEWTEMHPSPPAFEGNEPWRQQRRRFQYTIPSVHPGSEFFIKVGYVGEAAPVLRFESSQPLFATRRNLETWFVRHETGFLAMLCGFWLLALLIVLGGGRAGGAFRWLRRRVWIWS